MRWLLDDWRLKLLALVLAVLMLGAVAFSQNPTTTKTLALQLRYTQVGENQDLVIINPPSKVNVLFTGLSEIVGSATPDNFSATVDATRATPGPAVKLNISVTSTVAVTILNAAPIVVRVDQLAVVSLPIQVIAHGAPGWSVDTKKTTANPDHVLFSGPKSWTDHLTASVNIGTPIAGNLNQLLNQPVLLQNSSGGLSLSPCTTVPCASIDSPSVAVTVVAQTGTTSTTVPLNADIPSNPPPPGYQIVGVTVSPATVIITGDPVLLAKIQRIILPKVDLSGQTGTYKSQVQIQYPDGITPLNGVLTATITYTIQRNPSVSPSP